MRHPKMTSATIAILDLLVWDSSEPQYASVIGEECGLPLGTVMPTLAEFERLGWMVSEWDAVDPAETGHARRRLYTLTPVGEARGRSALDQAVGRLDRYEVDTFPAESWPKYRLDDHLLAAIVRVLPEPARQRYDEELGGEFAWSTHPISDAMSMLGNAWQLRRALGLRSPHRPLKCRLGRHVDLEIHTDRANHRAYYLRCQRCGRERNPGSDPEFDSGKQLGWASVTAA